MKYTSSTMITIILLMIGFDEINASNQIKKKLINYSATSVIVEETKTKEYNNNQFKFGLNSLDSKASFYQESIFKRSEIIFFLSIPFLFLINIAIVAATYLLATQETTFSNFPRESFFFISASSIMLAGGIIYFDIQKNKNLSQKTQDNRSLNLRYTYEF